MSRSAEFDRLAGAALDITVRGSESRMNTLLRLIFRAGSEARLDHGFAKLADDDPLTRLSWLMKQGMVSEDVKVLIREAEDRREQARAFTRTYGMTESDLRSMLAEGFHTAFRKAVDHPLATVIHRLIAELPPEDWSAVLDFVTEPVIGWLRQAESREKEASGRRAYEQFCVNEGRKPPDWTAQPEYVRASWTAIAAAAARTGDEGGTA